MEPHRPAPLPRDGKPPRKRSSARNRLPLGRAWLEQEAIRYVARWESSQRGVAEILARKLEARCERTGEDPTSAREEIAHVVAELVERGYIDDRRFAAQLYARQRHQGRSRAQIRSRLTAKGVSALLIDEIEFERKAAEREEPGEREEDEHSEVDEEFDAAQRTAKKRRLGPYATNATKRAKHRQRHLAVLARQGFSREIAHRVIDAGLADTGLGDFSADDLDGSVDAIDGDTSGWES